jgi:hypothetical protein
MDLFAKVEEDLAARRDSGALAVALQEWRARHRGLRRFGGLDDLIAACRDEGGRWKAADAALSALCQEASSGDDRAGVFLVWLLLPGLLIARARLATCRVLSLEDLTSEMLAGLWEEATQVLPPARRVAARLVNSARWRALAAIREAIGWAGRREPLADDVADRPLPIDQGTPGIEPDGLSEAVREGVLSQEEVELVLAHRRTIREISERLGITMHAAQMRRDRVRARLREWAGRTYRFPTRN